MFESACEEEHALCHALRAPSKTLYIQPCCEAGVGVLAELLPSPVSRICSLKTSLEVGSGSGQKRWLHVPHCGASHLCRRQALLGESEVW